MNESFVAFVRFVVESNFYRLCDDLAWAHKNLRKPRKLSSIVVRSWKHSNFENVFLRDLRVLRGGIDFAPRVY